MISFVVVSVILRYCFEGKGGEEVAMSWAWMRDDVSVGERGARRRVGIVCGVEEGLLRFELSGRGRGRDERSAEERSRR